MFKSAAISLLLAILPISSDLKVHVGLLLSELFSGVVLIWLMTRLQICKKQEITIAKYINDGEPNPLYEKFQDYLIYKFPQKLTSYELVPKNGEVDFSLQDMIGQKFEDIYNGNIIDLSVSEKQINGKADKYIIIKSKTASTSDIKKYVSKVTTTKTELSGTIKIFRPLISGKKKDEQVIRWESVVVKTNKSLNNTIYSEKVQDELFNSIESFMIDEQWYVDRGIPYKKGYLLYGCPGTGKTSVAKIIASKYNIPVFCLDLSTIDNNATLVKLMTEINYYTNFQKYILLMEDVERSAFFKNNRYNGNKKHKLSMDCLLNCIDGIVEPWGRLLIMSCNDRDPITRHNALIRPGRIDHEIELSYCDDYQLKKFYDLFYGSTNSSIDWSKWKLYPKLTPSYIIKLLQQNVNDSNAFLNLIGKPKDETIPDDVDKTFRADNNDEDHDNRSRRSRTGFRHNGRYDCKSKIKRVQSRIKHNQQKIRIHSAAVARYENKLPKLLRQLEQKENKEKIKNLREKAQRRKKYNETKELYNAIEPEYETPAFMLNSIPVDEIDNDTITTYEYLESDDECNKMFDELDKTLNDKPDKGLDSKLDKTLNGKPDNGLDKELDRPDNLA